MDGMIVWPTINKCNLMEMYEERYMDPVDMKGPTVCAHRSNVKEEMIRQGMYIPEVGSEKNQLEALVAKDIFDPVGKHVKAEEIKKEENNL
jgi:hypothetical protein